MVNMSELQTFIEETLGRPVLTHQLANKAIWEELKKKLEPDFIELCKEQSTITNTQEVFLEEEKRNMSERELKVWDIVKYGGQNVVVTDIDFTGKATTTRADGSTTRIKKEFIENHVVGNISDAISRNIHGKDGLGNLITDAENRRSNKAGALKSYLPQAEKYQRE